MCLKFSQSLFNFNICCENFTVHSTKYVNFKILWNFNSEKGPCIFSGLIRSGPVANLTRVNTVDALFNQSTPVWNLHLKCNDLKTLKRIPFYCSRDWLELNYYLIIYKVHCWQSFHTDKTKKKKKILNVIIFKFKEFPN